MYVSSDREQTYAVQGKADKTSLHIQANVRPISEARSTDVTLSVKISTIIGQKGTSCAYPEIAFRGVQNFTGYAKGWVLRMPVSVESFRSV